MTATGHRYGRRRGRALLVVGLLLALGAAVLLAGGRVLGPDGPLATSDDPSDVASAAPVDVDDLMDDAVTNPDGSVTVSLDDDQAAGLVASALTRASGRSLRDVSVDLVEPEGRADGRLLVRGRLDEPALPVDAVVDLHLVDDAVRPTVRDVSVGPVPVPPGTREDLNRQIGQLALVAEDQLTVEQLSTSDGVLELRGRPR